MTGAFEPATSDCASAAEVLTIGHSNLAIDQFLSLVAAQRIACVCDVRRFPQSRRFWHFNQTPLSQSLAATGTDYVHIAELGGRRRPTASAQNAGWQNEGFRAYADHMQTQEFARGLARLNELAGSMRTAVMCAEALWWRCHRRLLADALVLGGWRVTHIGSDGRSHPHQLTAFLVAEGGLPRYPPTQPSLDL